MKPTLLFATLSMVLASPTAFAKSELEILRSRCSEQERQIHQLEQENTKLRSGSHETTAAVARTETISSAIAKAEAPAATPSTSSYTVKAGDSLEKIARKVGASPQKLAKSNGLKATSIIRPGQKLKVPGASAAAATQTVAAATPSAAPTAGKTYKVKQGETFSSISRKHGISTNALVAANPKIKPSALRPGQVVSLGGGGSAPATTMIAATKAPAPVEKAPAPAAKAPAVHQNIPVSTPAPVSKPIPAPAAATVQAPAVAAAPETKPAPATAATPPAAEKETSSPAEKKIRPVTIDGEMTYGEFASKHGTDAERLNALNGLDLTTATVLAKGSELYVPAQP